MIEANEVDGKNVSRNIECRYNLFTWRQSSHVGCDVSHLFDLQTAVLRIYVPSLENTPILTCLAQRSGNGPTHPACVADVPGDRNYDLLIS